jgi:hypothetical protein
VRAARRALAGVVILAAVLAPPAAPGAQAAGASLPAARAVLSGYPHIRGVITVQDGSPASLVRDLAVAEAQQQLAGRAPAAASPSALLPDCQAGEDPGIDLCWWGGPVVRGAIVHLIFWQGEGEAHAFSSSYKSAVTRFFERVAGASAKDTNVFSVIAQYAGSDGAGEYRVLFEPSSDVFLDTQPLPASGTATGQCTDTASSEIAANPCVTEVDLRRAVQYAQNEENKKLGSSSTWGGGLEDIYLILTPPKVGGCFYGTGEGAGAENACAFASGGYCAYHSNFGSAKLPEAPEFASLPDDVGVEGCETYENPPGAEGANAALDSASHELSETISDPLGNGWHDLLGEEVGDKCVPPLAFEEVGAFVTGDYGGPLGGEPSRLGTGKEVISGTLFNEQIEGAEYWLQEEWSNSATAAGGACVQRMIPVEIALPQGASAGAPATLGGSAGEPSDPADYWVWSFGDGEQAGTAQPTIAHAYKAPGAYTVSLTAYDRYGNSNTTTKVLAVGPAAPPTTTSTSATVTTVTTTTSRSVRRYSPAALIKRLGLPPSARLLFGPGRIVLGHASCPPACALTLHIYTHQTRRHHGRRVRRAILIGSLKMGIGAGKSRPIALRLSAAGRRLLERLHRIAAEVQIIVSDAEGGAFTIRRTYTIATRTAPRAHARRARRRRSAERRR